jgi:hypothetical protein
MRLFSLNGLFQLCHDLIWPKKSLAYYFGLMIEAGKKVQEPLDRWPIFPDHSEKTKLNPLVPTHNQLIYININIVITYSIIHQNNQIKNNYLIICKLLVKTCMNETVKILMLVILYSFDSYISLTWKYPL